ncbi:hypothetical protein KSP40_PGU021141 [Platanthera guangdongensis]|uniref:Uncharacterized protein n=1 Tax=Platanthera guangdongensis TaxID=2320717 RepID=A0ABR2MM84_9ASPA
MLCANLIWLCADPSKKTKNIQSSLSRNFSADPCLPCLPCPRDQVASSSRLLAPVRRSPLPSNSAAEILIAIGRGASLQDLWLASVLRRMGSPRPNLLRSQSCQLHCQRGR